MANEEKIEGFSDPEIQAFIDKLMKGKFSRIEAVYISFIIENAMCSKNLEDTTKFIGTEGIKRIRKFVADAIAGN